MSEVACLERVSCACLSGPGASSRLPPPGSWKAGRVDRIRPGFDILTKVLMIPSCCFSAAGRMSNLKAIIHDFIPNWSESMNNDLILTCLISTRSVPRTSSERRHSHMTIAYEKDTPKPLLTYNQAYRSAPYPILPRQAARPPCTPQHR